jgi:lysophospholipid acyltransferase (LPLAT)-like uncharacterized protein
VSDPPVDPAHSRSRKPWTPSSRRLTTGRRLLYRCVAPLAFGILRAWWGLCRITRVVGAEHLVAALASGPVIPVYWHDSQLFCVRYLLGERKRGLRLGFLISPSVDGELPAMIAQRAGLAVVRGSSSHTGAQTLRAYYAAIKDGISTSINPDGPRGPPREFKPGPLLLSQMLGRPILPVATAASRTFRFRTWDRFAVPLPFSRVAIAVGGARTVPRGLDAAGLERWQRELADALDALERQATEALLS